MFMLYYKKEKGEIKVSKAKKVFHKEKFTEEPSIYNDCIILCSKKAPLVKAAEEMKNDWVKELEEELEKIKSIKV